MTISAASATAPPMDEDGPAVTTSDSDALIFDAAMGGLASAFDRYVHLYGSGADVEVLGDRFFASVRAQVIPGAVVFERTLREVAHVRDRRRVVRDGMEHLVLHVVRAGELRIDTGAERASLSAGQGVMVDMTRPFRSEVSGSLVTISTSRDRLRLLGLETADLHGAALRLFEHSEADLTPFARPIAGADAASALDRFLEVLKRRSSLRSTSPHASDVARQERARAFINAHLGEPDLAPSRIAQEVGVSRATLYRMFQPLGGVSEWVQARRLQHARALLSRTRLSIAEVGRSVGFHNQSHLSFAFQARFGFTPSAFRNVHQLQPARASGGAAALAALTDMAGALADAEA